MATGEGGPAHRAGSDESIDPRRAADPAELAHALTALRTRAGLTIREVSRVTGIPSATLGGWFSGRHLPPAGQKPGFAAVLRALGAGDSVETWWAELNRVRRVGGGRAGSGAPPYRGLDSYDVGDAEWYVGREELADELFTRVTGLLEEPEGPRLVSVVGASGSGKSSLLRAGLAARLLAADVATVVLVPGSDAVAELTSALDVVEGSSSRVIVVDQLEELFSAAEEERHLFLQRLVGLASSERTVVVTGLRADFYGAAVAEPLLLPLLRRHQLLLGPLPESALRRVVAEPATRAGRPPEPELVSLLLRDVVPAGRAPDASALPLLSHALLATWSRARGGRLTVADYLAVGGVAGAVQRTADSIYEALSADGQRHARDLFSLLVNIDEEGSATRRRLNRADLEGPELQQVAERFVDGRILTATETTIEISHEVLIGAWPRLQRWLEEDRELLLLRRRLGRAAVDWERSGRDPGALLRGALLSRAQDVVDRSHGGRLTALERSYVAASGAQADEERRLEQRRTQRLRAAGVALLVLAVVTSVLSVYLLESNREGERLREAAEHARNEARSRQAAVQSGQLRATEPALAAQLALVAFELSPTVEARAALLETTGLPAVSRLSGPPGTLAVAASPDGSVLAAAGADGKVRLWSVQQDAAPRALGSLEAAGGEALYAAAFSPDGRFVAVGGRSGDVTVVDVSDPAGAAVRWTVRSAGEDVSAVQGVAFDDDGRTLLAASGAQLLRWQVGRRLRALPPLEAATGELLAVAVAPDGRVAVGGAGGLLQVWRADGPRWRMLRDHSLGGGGHDVRSVDFAPDGALLAAGATDGVVRVHDTATGRLATELVGEFTSWVNALEFDRRGERLAAAASGGVVQVWDTRDWALEHVRHGPANYTAVSFLGGTDQLVTGDVGGTARLFEVPGQLLPAGDAIWGLTAPPDGEVAYAGVGSADPKVVRIDVSDPLEPRADGALRWRSADGDTLDGVAAVSPDGELLVAGTSQGRLVAWRDPAGDPRLVAEVHPATRLIENIAFSADGNHVAATADDGTTTVYAVGAGGLSHVATTDLQAEELALGVALSPDGSWVAVGGTDAKVRLWRTGEPDAPPVVLDGFENDVYALTFSPDGSLLAGGSTDATVRLWDVSDPEEPRTVAPPLRGPRGTIFSVAFDAEGSMLAAASQDGGVWLWRWEDGKVTPHARLGNLGTDLYQVLHHPTADAVLAAGAEGQAGVWSTDVTEARDMVCRTVGSPITEAEWGQYLPGVPFDPPC